MILLKLRKLLFMLTRPRYWPALMRSCAPSLEHQAIIKHKPWATLIDVGANRGQFTLLALDQNPSLKVFGFEPLSEAAATYRKIFNHAENATLYDYALGSTESSNVLNISRRNDSSSILPISEKQVAIFPGTEKVGMQKVAVRRLDSVICEDDIKHPSLLKIDVQGFELEVLKGAENLFNVIDDIYVEVSFVELYTGQPLVTDIVTYLSYHDFKLTGVHNVCYAGNGLSVQADMRFSRDTRAVEGRQP
jgi:FkbM family methyltransferase